MAYLRGVTRERERLSREIKRIRNATRLLELYGLGTYTGMRQTGKLMSMVTTRPKGGASTKFKNVVARAWFVFPEGKLKEKLRNVGLAHFRFYPIELTVRRGDTVVQVGATPHGGTFRMSRIVGKQGRVIAIEPDERNLRGLSDRIRRGGFRNITVVPKGAWSSRGTQTLSLSPHPADQKIDIPGVWHDAQLKPENYLSSAQIEVDTIDNILHGLGVHHVDFVRITINGAELEALKGMEDTLASKPRLWVKAHALKDGQPLNKSIRAFLAARGFVVYLTKAEGALVSKEFVRQEDIYAVGSQGQ